MRIMTIKNINNNKFSKVIQKNDLYYIFGIDTENVTKNINKFIIFYEVYDINFNFIKKNNINHSFDKSTLIWDISENEEEYIFLIEQKSIDLYKHKTQYYKYFIKKKNIELFKIEKIQKIDLEDHLICKIYKDYLFTSKIEIDEERPDYYWGKYLFYFQNDKNEFYRPHFDNVVSYDKDKGHLLHYIEENINIDNHKCDFDNDGNPIDRKYFIIFSIRHKYEDQPTKYYYKIYSAYSDDLIYFYDTKEIIIEDNISSSKWYCYPEIFTKDNKYHVLLGQDDFGKEKETLLGELIIDHKYSAKKVTPKDNLNFDKLSSLPFELHYVPDSSNL